MELTAVLQAMTQPGVEPEVPDERDPVTAAAFTELLAGLLAPATAPAVTPPVDGDATGGSGSATTVTAVEAGGAGRPTLASALVPGATALTGDPAGAAPPDGFPASPLAGQLLPTEALPTTALPTEALPTEALPTTALPTEALPAMAALDGAPPSLGAPEPVRVDVVDGDPFSPRPSDAPLGTVPGPRPDDADVTVLSPAPPVPDPAAGRAGTAASTSAATGTGTGTDEAAMLSAPGTPAPATHRAAAHAPTPTGPDARTNVAIGASPVASPLASAGAGDAADNADDPSQPEDAPDPGPHAIAATHRSEAPAVATGIAAAPEAAMTSPMDRALALQLVEHVGALRHREDGEYELTVQLEPADLGRIELRVRLEGGVVHIQVGPHAQATTDAVRRALPQLRDALADAGLTAGSLDVGTHRGQSDGRHDDAPAADHGRPIAPDHRRLDPTGPRPSPIRTGATSGVDVLL